MTTAPWSSSFARQGKMQATVILSNNNIPKKVDLKGPVLRGGEASVCFSKDGRYVVKLYHNQNAKKERQKRLEKVLELGLTLGNNKRYLCWPEGIVTRLDNKAVIGCIVPRVNGNSRELVDFIFSPKQAAEQFKKGRNWADYLRIARLMTHSVVVIHSMGCAHADLHFKNYLCELASGLSVLIDLDGLVIRGLLPPNVDGMTGFMAPEIVLGKEQPQEITDRHSLAVLLFHTLLFRNPLQPLVTYDDKNQANDDRLSWGKFALFSEHPSDYQNRPKTLGQPLFRQGALSYLMLTPSLQKLIREAFVNGLHDPEKRPLAKEWESALAETIDNLWQCYCCRQYFPYPYWLCPKQRRTCPFCGTRCTPPFPAVLGLYEPVRDNYFMPTSRHLVIGHGWSLFDDMVRTRTDPPLSRATSKIIGQVQLKNDDYWLRNHGKNAWLVFLGEERQKIPCGAAVRLQPNLRICFGQDRRLVSVMEG